MHRSHDDKRIGPEPFRRDDTGRGDRERLGRHHDGEAGSEGDTVDTPGASATQSAQANGEGAVADIPLPQQHQHSHDGSAGHSFI